MWSHFKALFGSRGGGGTNADAERDLWPKLRELKHLGFHFRRQDQVMSYVLDFVEHDARLVITIDDGAAAKSNQANSKHIRDSALLTEGYRILPLRPVDILSDINGVTDRIVMELLLKSKAKRRTPASAPVPANAA